MTVTYFDRFTSFCFGASLMGLIAVALWPSPCIEYVTTPPPRYPTLYGLDCAGASGPLFAYEEDHFPPPCKEIGEYAPD